MSAAPADLLVIGGGVLGMVTAAFARLDHPDWTIRLVERGRVGQGATGASAGLSFPIARTPWQRAVVEDSARGWNRLAEHFPHLPVHDVDVVWVLDADQVPELTGRLVGGPPVPVRAELAAAMHEALPDFRMAPGEVAVTTAQRCFYSYPGRLVEQLAAWLRATDPHSVQEGVPVCGVGGSAEDGWEVTLGDGRTMRARRVVSAVGPWAGSLRLPHGPTTARVRVKKVAALHLAHSPPPKSPCVVLWRDDAFVLPLPERGHSLFSYTSTTWDVDPSQQLELTAEDIGAALAVLGPRSARLADAYAGGRVFCDGYTEERVARLQTRPGFAEIGGCSGSGVRMAPGLATAALAAVT